jgi:Uma2 family endonuclease
MSEAAAALNPDAISPYELERGKPVPSQNHAFAQSFLIGELLKHREQFTVLSELELATQPRHSVPDLAVYPVMKPNWQHDELRKLEPPLVTVEIYSKSQGVYDFEDKVRSYFEFGVRSCWIVNPFTQSLTILRPGQPPLTYGIVPFTDPTLGVEIDLREVFIS